MPLWLVALLFLIGLAWIADRSVTRLLEGFSRFEQSLSDSNEDWEDRLTALNTAIGHLGLRLEKTERLLLPMAAIAEYRMEKIGWSKFTDLHSKMAEIIKLAEPEKFSVVLTDVGANKIGVIKAVREVTGLSLKGSLDLVDGAPRRIKEGISKETAMTIKTKFEDAGAHVEVSTSNPDAAQ